MIPSLHTLIAGHRQRLVASGHLEALRPTALSPQTAAMRPSLGKVISAMRESAARPAVSSSPFTVLFEVTLPRLQPILIDLGDEAAGKIITCLVDYGTTVMREQNHSDARAHLESLFTSLPKFEVLLRNNALDIVINGYQARDLTHAWPDYAMLKLAELFPVLKELYSPLGSSQIEGTDGYIRSADDFCEDDVKDISTQGDYFFARHGWEKGKAFLDDVCLHMPAYGRTLFNQNFMDGLGRRIAVALARFHEGNFKAYLDHLAPDMFSVEYDPEKKYCSLYAINRPTDDIIPFLKRIPHIRHINLISSSITDGGLNELVPALENIETLHLPNCQEMTEACLRNWAGLASLTSLDIGHTRIRFSAMNTLSQLPWFHNLTHLNVSDLNLAGEELALVATRAPALEELHFDGNSIEDSEYLSWLYSLPLKRLSLSRTHLPADALPHLAILHQLTDLNISNNAGISAEAVEALQAALPHTRINTPRWGQA